MRALGRLTVGLLWLFSTTPDLVASQSAAKPPAQRAPATAAAVKLPPAVEAAFKAAYPDAVIKKVIKEKHEGKDVYEVESIDRGKTRDILYYPDGVIALLEEGITAAEVPAPVTASIKSQFPKATVTRYEKVVENGAIRYEIQLKGARVSSAEFLPDGKLVK